MHFFVLILGLLGAQSEWAVTVGEYLDTYRAFFSEDGGSPADAARLKALAERAQAAAPNASELRSALESDDARRVALATASLSVSEHPSAGLLSELLRKFGRQPDAVARRLSIVAFSRADDAWLSDHGAELAREVSGEKDPLVTSVVISGLLPRLDRGDELVAAAGLASVATSASKRALYGSLYLRGGSPALEALAGALRRAGRPGQASEVEAAARALSCNRSQALAVAEETAVRAKAMGVSRTQAIIGPNEWKDFFADQGAIAGELPANATGALSGRRFYAVTLGPDGGPNEAYWVFIEESNCRVLYAGWLQ